MIVKFHGIISYTWNFQNFTCVITILVKFDIHFLGLPWEIFFGVTTDDLLHLKALKNVKKSAIFFKLFWYKVFVHWKLKLLNSLMDSVLTHQPCSNFQETYFDFLFHSIFAKLSKTAYREIKSHDTYWICSWRCCPWCCVIMTAKCLIIDAHQNVGVCLCDIFVKQLILCLDAR